MNAPALSTRSPADPGALDVPAAAARPWSLHTSLRVIGLSVAAVAGLIGSVSIYSGAQAERAAMLDEQLKVLAHTVVTFSEHELIEVREAGLTQDPIHRDSTAAMTTGYRYQIWGKDGTLLLYSSNASPRTPMLPLDYRGYKVIPLGSVPYRAFAAVGRLDGMVVQVAIPQATAEVVVGPKLWELLLFSSIAFGVLFVASGWFLRRALRPVADMAGQLRERGPNDLARLDVGPPPAELVPIVKAINSLFARIEQTMSNERGFIGMAAHELRTPLSGLRLQAQILSSSTSASERRTLAEGLAQSVDRVSHTVDQLLDHTRLHEAESTPLALETVDLRHTFERVMSDLQHHPSMADKVVVCELDGVCVQGDQFGLTTLMRNLLANAAMYSPEGATVRIGAQREGAFVVLDVDDSGPGIPVHERQRVFDRFYRGAGRGGTGSGLGLTIVQSIVKRHRGTVEMRDSPLGGLRVHLRFPSSGATHA